MLTLRSNPKHQMQSSQSCFEQRAKSEPLPALEGTDVQGQSCLECPSSVTGEQSEPGHATETQRKQLSPGKITLAKVRKSFISTGTFPASRQSSGSTQAAAAHPHDVGMCIPVNQATLPFAAEPPKNFVQQRADKGTPKALQHWLRAQYKYSASKVSSSQSMFSSLFS